MVGSASRIWRSRASCSTRDSLRRSAGGAAAASALPAALARFVGDRVNVMRQPETVDALGARDADAGLRDEIDGRTWPGGAAAVGGACAAAQEGDQLRVGPSAGRRGVRDASVGDVGRRGERVA